MWTVALFKLSFTTPVCRIAPSPSMTSRECCRPILTPGTTRAIVPLLPDVPVPVYYITSAELHKHCAFPSRKQLNKTNDAAPLCSFDFSQREFIWTGRIYGQKSRRTLRDVALNFALGAHLFHYYIKAVHEGCLIRLYEETYCKIWRRSAKFSFSFVF